jgi:hypothetical protein
MALYLDGADLDRLVAQLPRSVTDLIRRLIPISGQLLRMPLDSLFLDAPTPYDAHLAFWERLLEIDRLTRVNVPHRRRGSIRRAEHNSDEQVVCPN